MMNPNPGTALYLYCLVSADSPIDLNRISSAGVDEQSPLIVIQDSHITAIISEVALADFAGEEAETRLKDLAWLGPRALRHEAVIEQVMSQTAVIPARFGTLFSSQSKLTAFLAAHQSAIRQSLAELAGHQEFAVKTLLFRERAKSALATERLSSQAQDLGAVSPGARYFQQKKIAAAAEQELTDWLQTTCTESAVHFNACAEKFAERKVITRTVTVSESGTEMEVIAIWALLISARQVNELRLRVDAANARYQQHGLFFELTGPWPPYTFAPALSAEAET